MDGVRSSVLGSSGSGQSERLPTPLPRSFHIGDDNVLSSTLNLLYAQNFAGMLKSSLTGPCCTTACFRHICTQHPYRALSFHLQQQRIHCSASGDSSNGVHDAELPKELQGALSPSPVHTSENFPSSENVSKTYPQTVQTGLMQCVSSAFLLS